jgi:hypothetical protein
MKPKELLKEGVGILIIGSTVAVAFLIFNPMIKSDSVRFSAGGVATIVGYLVAEIAVKELFKDRY